jgi:hypothetical protein
MIHILFSFTAAILLCPAFFPDKGIVVKGRVMKVSQYCGGAEISPEEMAEYAKPRTWDGARFYVRKGIKNNVKEPVVASFVTDKDGNFSITLPPGDYCIVEPRKCDKKYINKLAKDHKKASEYYEAADINCLTKWLSQPEHIFTVKEGARNTVEMIYQNPCEWMGPPCVGYTGPPPP